MELIDEIYEENLGIPFKNGSSYKLRRAARAIIFDENDFIPLLYVKKDKYHKLPGGGVEDREGLLNALAREVMEEVGARIIVLGEVGIIIEFRDEMQQVQLSYCFSGKVEGEIISPSFTEEEAKDGFELKWCTLAEAIQLVREDNPLSYLGKFIQKRDLTFLEYFLQEKI